MVVIANYFLLINSIVQVVGKIFAVEYLPYLRLFFANYMSILEKVKKSIPRTTSILVSANKKVSSKNQTFLSLP